MATPPDHLRVLNSSAQPGKAVSAQEDSAGLNLRIGSLGGGPVALCLKSLIGLEDWEAGAAMARKAVAEEFHDDSAYFLGAHAIRRMGRVADARQFLLSGESRLEDQALFHFDLACYECQIGNLTETELHLARAFQLDATLRGRARQEADLSPLWANLLS